MRRWSIAAFVTALAALAGPAASAGSPFANWAAIVVSGDFHAAHTNNPTETFDNARRDVSVRPELYPQQKVGKADLQPIYEGLRDVAGQATGGCLVYFSSHGAPQG